MQALEGLYTLSQAKMIYFFKHKRHVIRNVVQSCPTRATSALYHAAPPSLAVCCSVLQCAAVCCSVLQCAAVCCSVLQCAAVNCNMLQCVTYESLRITTHLPVNPDHFGQAPLFTRSRSRDQNVVLLIILRIQFYRSQFYRSQFVLQYLYRVNFVAS